MYGETASATSTDVKKSDDSNVNKLKACCVCKETKGKRDECIILNGEESCGQFIEAHKKCMREHGFDI
uniref:Cytochrome c oxidase copper chaperone n=1 Tax=Globodera rostochiensis TaxID=31243 RepID=A0A914HDB8_GLORO